MKLAFYETRRNNETTRTALTFRVKQALENRMERLQNVLSRTNPVLLRRV